MAQDATEHNDSPAPGNPTAPEPPATGQGAAPGANNASAATPPWERDGEQFDAEKAWNLIQHLREDNAKLKESNETNGAKLKQIEDAKLTEQEKLQRDLKDARQQLAEVNMAKAWAEARAAHPCLTEQDFDLIGGGTPEEIAGKAAKLAARIDAQAASKRGQENINPLRRTPAKPSGGTDPTSAPSKDWLRAAMLDK